MKSSVGFSFFCYIRLRVFAWVFLRIVAGCCLSIEWKTVARKRSGGRVYGEARYLSNPPDRTARNN